jgi:hypothetical protein
VNMFHNFRYKLIHSHYNLCTSVKNSVSYMYNAYHLTLEICNPCFGTSKPTFKKAYALSRLSVKASVAEGYQYVLWPCGSYNIAC